jgi:hypothetical protein
MGHFKGYFEGAKTFLTPKIVPRNGPLCSLPKTKKNNVPNFQNQRCIGIFMCRCDHMPHIVGRVLSVSPVVGIGTPPPLLPQASVPPLPFGPGGRAHSVAAKGVGETQFQRGGTYTVVLYIYKYFVICPKNFLS